MVYPGLTSKSVARVSRFGSKNQQLRFDNLSLKITATVSWFGSKNQQLRFDNLSLKITATVSWFVTQNQASFGLPVAPQNQWREIGVGYTSRSSGLLHVKASWARVS
jgi:hypothetical protein